MDLLLILITTIMMDLSTCLFYDGHLYKSNTHNKVFMYVIARDYGMTVYDIMGFLETEGLLGCSNCWSGMTGFPPAVPSGMVGGGCDHLNRRQGRDG